MSNFTDFFPAAAGGGIGQTITVGDVSYPNSRTLTEWAGERIAVGSWNGSPQFNMNISVPNSGSPTNFQIDLLPLGNNTYGTVADITGATNGGALTFIGASSWFAYNVSNSAIYTMRITLDGGTPVEFVSNDNTANGWQHVFFVGSYESASRVANQAMSGISGTQLIANGNPTQKANQSWNGTDNHFYLASLNTGGQNDCYLINAYNPQKSMQMGMPYVYFTSSCKVEIKCNAGTSLGVGKGMASILTF